MRIFWSPEQKSGFPGEQGLGGRGGTPTLKSLYKSTGPGIGRQETKQISYSRDNSQEAAGSL